MREMSERCGYRVESMTGVNAIGSMKFKLFNAVTLGRFSEMGYLQFVCVMKLAADVDREPQSVGT